MRNKSRRKNAGKRKGKRMKRNANRRKNTSVREDGESREECSPNDLFQESLLFESHDAMKCRYNKISISKVFQVLSRTILDYMIQKEGLNQSKGIFCFSSGKMTVRKVSVILHTFDRITGRISSRLVSTDANSLCASR
jgi:hypothetical protein